ncbi:MAG: 30S ribosomal protein S2 [Alphaproteobacteria bacterium]|nr:30S ribosomal protein S2 [Alphaproteobacteria bacterium]
MANFTIQQLLENGVHYGHATRRWNPKMAPFIYGTYNNVHIINLQKTAPMLANALDNIRKTTASGGRILFVGTKKQATPIVKEYAEKCGQYYVNHRWLGGMLTNWKTISNSISKLDSLDKQIEEGMVGLTKKERLELSRQQEKLNLVLGGIRKMGGLPNLVVVLDTVQEAIAIEESRKLGIPIVGIVDTNANPDNIDFPVPGNDDAIKSIRFYCEIISQTILEGLKEEVAAKTEDMGAVEDLSTVVAEPSKDN